MRATLVAFTLLLALACCEKREQPASSTSTQLGVHVTAVEGRVRIKRAGALAWVDATLATVLEAGDLISTDDKSTAKLQFTDGTLFDVRSDSLITILENSRDVSRQPHVGVGIESGEARFQTSPSAGETRIETPSGRATPERETEGNVRVARGGEAAVRIYRGKSKVETSTGQQLSLGPSESIRMGAEGMVAPASVFALPKPAVPIAADQGGTWSGVIRPPQLALDMLELKGTQLHVVGRTEADVNVTVNGVRIPVQGDGSFNEHVVMLGDTPVISVRAAGDNGAITEQRLPVTTK